MSKGLAIKDTYQGKPPGISIKFCWECIWSGDGKEDKCDLVGVSNPGGECEHFVFYGGTTRCEIRTNRRKLEKK